MGCWAEYCLLCGGPPLLPEVEIITEYLLDEEKGTAEQEAALRAALTELEWLGSFVGILETEDLIPLGPYDSSGGFSPYDENTETIITAKLYINDPDADDADKSGRRALTCHEKCYTLLQRELGYTLRFQDVWPMLMEQEAMDRNLWGRNITGNSFRWTSYGGIGAYLEQEFSFTAAVADGNAWMLEDPTTNERNARRIVDVWRKIVDSGFKTPPENETTDEIGRIRVGVWADYVCPSDDYRLLYRSFA